MQDRDDRLPLPSEDTGDLVDEPATGETDDYLVAQEEGVPYVPPTERVLSEPRASEAGVDYAGTDPTDAGELEREDSVQADTDTARDDELLADAIEALRTSDVPSGDRIRLGVNGTQLIVRGEVESVEIGDEILAIVGDVPGVSDVVDELEVTGA